MVGKPSDVRISAKITLVLAILSLGTRVGGGVFSPPSPVRFVTPTLNQQTRKPTRRKRPNKRVLEMMGLNTGRDGSRIMRGNSSEPADMPRSVGTIFFRPFPGNKNKQNITRKVRENWNCSYPLSRRLSDKISLITNNAIGRQSNVDEIQRKVPLIGFTGTALLILVLVAFPFQYSKANERQIPKQFVEMVRNWAKHPTTIMTVRRWNERHEGITESDIKKLDRKWKEQRTEAVQPLIARIHGSPLSSFLLRKKADMGGRLFESFVMDRHGLTVGLSSVTSDYLQGDEAKFQESYGAGPDGIYFGPVEQKAETGHRTQQVSLTITDPKTSEPIGAITAEFNLDILELY